MLQWNVAHQAEDFRSILPYHGYERQQKDREIGGLYGKNSEFLARGRGGGLNMETIHLFRV